jgi:hypothetical protein
MDSDLEQLRDLGGRVLPAGDETRAGIRDRLLAEASNAVPTARKRSNWVSRRGLAVLAAALVFPGALAVAAGLNGDVADNLSEFLTGRASTHEIGRAVEPSDDPPRWMTADDIVDKLVIASNGPYELFAGRDREGHVSFSLGDSPVLTSGTGANPFVNQFEGDSVIPLFAGPGNESGRFPIAGVVADDVASVELTYSSGPPDQVDVTGAGFIFLPDLGKATPKDGILLVDRVPLEIEARDADGNLLQTQPAGCSFGTPVMVLRSTPDPHAGPSPACEGQ